MDARIAAGHASRVDACRRFDFNVNTLKAHEYGHRSFNRSEAERYAAAFETSADELLSEPKGAGGRRQPSAPRAHQMVREIPNAHHNNAPHGADDGTKVGTGGADGTHSAPSDRTIRTTDNERNSASTSRQMILDVTGAIAYGIWTAPGSAPLHADTPIAPVPGHPADRQYARQVLAGSRSGEFRAGDYVIFLRFEPTHRLPPGRYDVRRSKGQLSESAIWISSGRTLECDSAEMESVESFEFDPDDPTVKIEGVALAVYKPIKATP
ncbi:hypothetical protein G6L37_01110 [Agrobacterium rubi]|nr:hypothetical protein [Agrobacterium rubi]NTF23990.1 hypothetical protein [Agrobacterium rubi]